MNDRLGCCWKAGGLPALSSATFRLGSTLLCGAGANRLARSPLGSGQRYGKRPSMASRRGLRTGCAVRAPAGRGRKYLLVLLAQASARIYGYLSRGAPKCGQQGAATLAMVLSATYCRRPRSPDDSKNAATTTPR